METNVTFGVWLEKRRKALDLTREELARKIGTSTSALRKIESDERRPSKQLAELLANALDISAQDRPLFVRIARGQSSSERLSASHPLPTLSLLQPPQTFSNPIPIPPTPLIGRENELAALHQMLGDAQCRLITLVGPGGSGKTRLAMEIALQQSANVALVLLANVNSSSMIVPAIAEAVGFAFCGSADPKVQLRNYLREKHMLLVLDNMEHLMDGTDLIAEILHFAPHLKLLCTSREPFNLRGEWVFEVGGLDFPKGEAVERAENYSAVALFVQCAQRVKTRFMLTAEDLAMVTRICTMVEGVPLAIELAAAWVRTLSCREIAEEIEQNLDILFTSARDMPERHHSIQAVFDHSWNLLSEQERQVLARLSVFRGGFTRLAAEQVTGASLAILSSLVSKSLVQRNDTEGYNLHDILHQYAAAHLEADPQASREQESFTIRSIFSLQRLAILN
jgi:predicted ATPase/DNA-binding XRE family transcriptional regulator